MLVKLDGRTGDVLQRLPFEAYTIWTSEKELEVLPGQYLVSWPRFPKFVPLSNGELVVTDMIGNFVTIGVLPETGRPTLALSNAYPLPGEPVRLNLSIREGDDARRLLVLWGDKSFETFTLDHEPYVELQHTYGSPQRYEVLASVVYSDGRTASQRTTVDVGGTPPPPLNFMQRLFSPERQDMTWGIIGLAIAATGGVFALAKRHRRHGRLERRLRVLEDIRKDASTNAPQKIRELEGFRRTLRRDLQVSRLDDSQYSVLSQRLAVILRAQYLRLLAPYKYKLTPGYDEMLVAAFEDGFVNESEADALVRGLEDQPKLPKAEREDLRHLIQAWAAGS